MSFIKQYDPRSISILYSEEFKEGSQYYLYTVGFGGSSPTIIKTSRKGETIWHKDLEVSYDSNGNPLKFSKIIQKIIKNRCHYILSLTDENSYFLCNIDCDGNFLWINKVDEYFPYENVSHLVSSMINNDFYLISSINYVENLHFPTVLHFDIDCNLVGSRMYPTGSSSDFTVDSAISYSGGIALVGKHKGGLIHIVDVAYNLDEQKHIMIDYGNSDFQFDSHDIFVHRSYKKDPIKNQYIISGYDNIRRSAIFFGINDRMETTLHLLPESSGMKTALCKRKNDFYLTVFDPADMAGTKRDVVYRIDPSGDISSEHTKLWTKKVNLGKRSRGLRRLTYQSGIDSLTAFSVDGLFLIHSASDLETCVTKEIRYEIEKERTVPYVTLSSYKEDLFFRISEHYSEFEKVTTIASFLCPFKRVSIDIDSNTALQSANLILNAAGSTSSDGSAYGIHLRWLFGGALGASHLPKGNYSANNFNFNKTEDFVTLYRTPYKEFKIEIDFQNIPNVVNNQEKFWIYKFGTKMFYVHFRNTNKYDEVLNDYNPLENPLQFIVQYENEIIEIESKKDLFFTTTVQYSNSGIGSSSKMETLSVNENLNLAPKHISSRITFTGAALNNTRLVCENGRSIRLQAFSCHMTNVYFELYSDFIVGTNENESWEMLGEFSLTLDDDSALLNLEPIPGLIDKKWARFNDGALVNIENYIEKWNGPIIDENRNVKKVVERYLELSESGSNPTGIEQIFLGNDQDPYSTENSPQDDYSDVPMLDMINIGATDFHIARLLGLGTLDIFNSEVEESYVYLTSYTTLKDINNPSVNKVVNHLSMSLPTTVYDERLPIPYELGEIVPGIFDTSVSGSTNSMTADNGYTHDGKYRYVTLFAKPIPDSIPNLPFYNSNHLFYRNEYSIPLFAGLEYKMDSDVSWVKPELSHDSDYYNTVPEGETAYFETVPIVVSDETLMLIVHKQAKSGIYKYNSYGINIFSRATNSSTTALTITTALKTVNNLKPPSNINALLVTEESPLLFTSQTEQVRLKNIGTSDKTLVRLTFDYHSYQDKAIYQIEDQYSGLSNQQIISNLSIYPDAKDVFAHEIELFFRNSVPDNISGKVLTIDIDTEELLCIVTTGSYYLASANQTLTPLIPANKVQNYIGSLFVMGDQQFIIHEINNSGTFPIFKLLKKQISDTIESDDGVFTDVTNLESIQLTNEGYFIIVENMQILISWATPPNPHSLKITIGAPDWTVKRNMYQTVNEDGVTERFLEKTRGFWKTGTVTIENEVVEDLDLNGNYQYDSNGNLLTESAHNGLYKIVFTGFTLPQHSQFVNNVEWYKGIVRLKTNGAPNGEPRVCQIIQLENIGIGNLVVYFRDQGFDRLDPLYDKIKTGAYLINLYPGYRVYLYQNNALGLNAQSLLPEVDEGVRHSIFGLRTHSLNNDYLNYFSQMSSPVLLFAQEVIAPLIPDPPMGSLYATRPDFFGKATYTFTTLFQQRPHSAIFGRTNDESLLNVLYTPETVSSIRKDLEHLNGNDEKFLTKRWTNFFDFKNLEESYEEFSGYALPLPDNKRLIKGIEDFIIWHNQNNGSFPDANLPFYSINALNEQVIGVASGLTTPLLVIHFIEEAVYNTFVPLTELPIIYQYIKPNLLYPQDYNPIPKKQHIRDRNGHLLPTTDPIFDMAPMAKIFDKNTVQFTDFTLDGTSKNIYFYAVREMGSKLKLGNFSKPIGPIKLINTNYPDAPAIKKIVPELKNEILGITAAVRFEINSYLDSQYIRKINLYRTFERINAESIRTMTLVNEIYIETAGLLDESIWNFQDDFANLEEIRYGDPIYYRVTVSRQVEYKDADSNAVVEYAPSFPSKITATTIMESSPPESPELKYYAEPLTGNTVNHITLYWNKTAYKGTYYVFKMNNQGNWVKIHTLQSNSPTVYLQLEETDLDSSSLNVFSTEEGRIYHHFKVIAENTSGMLSTKENILTIYNEVTWQDIGGISTMIVGPTFIVRS